MTPTFRPLLFSASLVLALAGQVLAQPTPTPREFRLYDTTPVSDLNPVLARIKGCDLEIPRSEFAAYVAATGDQTKKPGPLSLEQKRALLDRLIDEHLLVWSAYQKKTYDRPELAQRLEASRRSIMIEALRSEELAAQPKNTGDDDDWRRAVFEKAGVVVDDAALVVAADAVPQLRLPEAFVPPPNRDVLPPSPIVNLPAAVRNRPLAQWRQTTISVGSFLSAYARKAPAERPPIRQLAAAKELLREMLEPAILLAAAQARDLEKSPAVHDRQVVQMCVLLRSVAQEEITAEAIRRVDAPGQEDRIKTWHLAQAKSRSPDASGDGAPAVSAENEREHVQNEYVEFVQAETRAEKLRALRQEQPISVDEAQLAASEIVIPEPPEYTLAPDVVSWNADSLEHVLTPTEKTVEFIFHLKNVSSRDVTILEARGSCECTTVQTPHLPWTLVPGQEGELKATIDLQGKIESALRTVYLKSTRGDKSLLLTLQAPK